jgi:predicted RNA-binding protein YlxR (DUF448 family)
MYHKLHNIITNKIEREKDKKKIDRSKKESKDKPLQDELMTYLQNED